MTTQTPTIDSYAVNYIPTNIISSGNGYSITPAVYDLQYMSLTGYYYFTLPEGLEPVQQGVPVADVTLTDRYAVYEFTTNEIEPITRMMTPSEVVQFYDGQLKLLYENTWENALTYSTLNQEGRLYNFPVTNVVSFVGDQVTDGVIARPIDSNPNLDPKRYLFTVDIPKIVDNTNNRVLQMDDILCDLFLTYKDGIEDYSLTDLLSVHNRQLLCNIQDTWTNVRRYLPLVRYLPIIRSVVDFLL